MIARIRRVSGGVISVKNTLGLVGLGVMGKSLALNFLSKGHRLSVYNLEPEVTRDFLQAHGQGCLTAAYSLKELVGGLDKPRKVLLMIVAGKPVDDVLAQLLEHLEPGDIVIDGGNSNYQDTDRRVEKAQERGIRHVGMGVSGGEEGALKGPCLMPGGNPAAWPHIQPIVESIAAKIENDVPCCRWIGGGGSGHYVKMVHNGIEYGDLQLICEVYHFMRDGMRLSHREMADIFGSWNAGALGSYLIEITADILARAEQGEPLVAKILDAAGQKGTGKWTVIEALERGTPLTLIAESVMARSLAAAKEERVAASALLGGPDSAMRGYDKQATLKMLHGALYASKIISYAQGYALLAEASRAFGWALDLGTIALLWRGGCIIRSVFLEKISEAYGNKPGLPNLMLDPYFHAAIEEAQPGWRQICCQAMLHGMPMPALYAALSYYDGYRCANLPANLLQAQRDYFGAHRYERIDAPRGQFFHTEWLREE